MTTTIGNDNRFLPIILLFFYVSIVPHEPVPDCQVMIMNNFFQNASNLCHTWSIVGSIVRVTLCVLTIIYQRFVRNDVRSYGLQNFVAFLDISVHDNDCASAILHPFTASRFNITGMTKSTLLTLELTKNVSLKYWCRTEHLFCSIRSTWMLALFWDLIPMPQTIVFDWR